MRYYYCTYGIKYTIDDKVYYETLNVPSLISKANWYLLNQLGKDRFITQHLRYQRAEPENIKLTPFISELDFWQEHYDQ